MSTIEVKVPDIGDFKDVPVIEVLVKPGDTVAAEDSLVTLESDKATMDVPSPAAGVVKDLKVKLGDKVSEGSLILTLEAAGDAAAKPAPAAASKSASSAAPPKPGSDTAPSSSGARAAKATATPSGAAAAPAPAAATYSGSVDLECEMLVLGSGPGGYSAAFRAADLGMRTVLVERYPTLGGVCLNVGCIPSKALLHTAAVMDEVKVMAAHGISYSAPQIDLAKLRSHKERVVGRLTGGLAGMAKARKVAVLEG